MKSANSPEILLQILAERIRENYKDSKKEILTDENLSTKEYMESIKWGVIPTLENPSFKERFKRVSHIFREHLSDLTNVPVISPHMNPAEYTEGFSQIIKQGGWLVHESDDLTQFQKGDENWGIAAVRLHEGVSQEAYAYFPRKEYMMIAKRSEGAYIVSDSNKHRTALHTSKNKPARNMVVPRYPEDVTDMLLAAPLRIAYYQSEHDIQIHMVNGILARTHLIVTGEVDLGYEVEYLYDRHLIRSERVLLLTSDLLLKESGGYSCNLVESGEEIDYSKKRIDGTGYVMCNQKENAPAIVRRINQVINRKSLLIPTEVPEDLSALLAPRRGHKKNN